MSGDVSGALEREVAGWPDPAASVVVVGPGGQLAALGDLDLDRGWASVTKIVSALTVLVLAHDGEADLGAPVQDAGGPPGAVLRDVLDHTSGLDFSSDAVRARVGERRIYSNTGIEVAARHVEALTGAPFAELAGALVAQPLGMARTRLEGSPAHGLVAPTADLAVLARELLAPRVLPAAVVDLLRTPSRPGLSGVLPGFGRQAHNDWGLGAEVRADKHPHWTSPDNAPETFGHFGQSGTALWVDRSAGAAGSGGLGSGGLALVTASAEPFGEWATTAWPRLSGAVLRTWG